MGVQMLSGYKDPYHGRSLTKGELGCFLSHYNTWKEVREPHAAPDLVLGPLAALVYCQGLAQKITNTSVKNLYNSNKERFSLALCLSLSKNAMRWVAHSTTGRLLTVILCENT